VRRNHLLVRLRPGGGELPAAKRYDARFEGDAVVVVSKSSEAGNLMPANDNSGAQLTIIYY